MFSLAQPLANDTHRVGYLPLCQLLLAKDANYPWCILVPQRDDIREIHHLKQQDQIQLMMESSALAQIMESLFQPVKMNVAALGNRVPQLHIHHIARFKDDAAWPKPIWDVAQATAYSNEQCQQRLAQLREALHAKAVGFYE